MVKSYDIKIDGEPYIYTGSGITLGDALIDPAPVSQLGTALIENVSNGLGPKISRGNGYYDIHRLLPTVEGQLIFPPRIYVGAEFSMSGTHDNYTPGIFHHPCAAGQYIAYDTRIYRLNLIDFVGLTYTLVAGSECTAAPISNANARYTGGAFVWRNRIYFGIENALNGGAIGYAWVDFAADDDQAFIVNDPTKAFSYAAASRGRLFLAQNRAAPEHTRLSWSPKMDMDYTAMTAGTDIYGDNTTPGGTFIYGIEGRPRVSWVLMMGSAALFFRIDGSVLASDEAGFIGIATPRSQSSGTEDKTQGFGAVHYLDGAAFQVFTGGPHHLNPVTLLTRSLSPGNVQDITIEPHDPDINALNAVGEHLFMAGDKFLYDVLWKMQAPIVHKIMNVQSLAANTNYIVGAMTTQGGIMGITMHNKTTDRIQQIHMELLPSQRVSTEVYAGASLQGWIEPGVLVGPERATSMTKLWLQLRGTHYTRVNSGNSLTFTGGLVDETKAVSIGAVTAPGPFAAPISGAPDMNRLGRTLSFRMNMNVVGYTGFEERMYFPLMADFLWSPTDTDMLTINVLATSEQPTRVGGVLQSRSARSVADRLLAKRSTIINLEFSDGNPIATWTMFVEQAKAEWKTIAESGRAADSYEVMLVCRRLS